ncbi:MAG: M48 family metallopeptidase [bacterium]
MKTLKPSYSLVISFFLILLFNACSKNLITGSRQFLLLPESEVQAMALAQYNQFISDNKVLDSRVNREASRVKEIGARISDAITKYYSEKGNSSVFDGYKWEYNLVDSKEVNAWCMPGGKIVVYTGLLPITKNEDALAVVIGHEIAHAIAKHGNQRMSEGIVQQFGSIALSAALASKPEATQDIFLTAYGVGSTVGIMLPHSRKQELEADKFGLRFAALAGYNIREAVPLWTRMKNMKGDQQPPVFLSTHPSDDQRIRSISNMMNQTIKDYYRPYRK